MNNTNQAGKGDKPRPVNKKQFNVNFDEIDWGSTNAPKETKKAKGKITYKY